MANESDPETSAIIDYALENPDNLEMALRVARVGEKLREKVIANFLQQVEQKTIDQLGLEWKCQNNFFKTPLRKWKRCSFYKKDWINSDCSGNEFPVVQVAIEADYNGPSGVGYGVAGTRDSDNVNANGPSIPDQLHREIKKRIKDEEILSKSLTAKKWPVYKYFEESDWTKPVSVRKLFIYTNNKNDYKDERDSVPSVSRELIDLCKCLEACVNRYFSEK